MPAKVCVVCADFFFARWRNTPAVCSSCALATVICPECWHVRVTTDPAQLALELTLAPGQRPLSAVIGDHFANHLPRSFDWETYTETLLSARPPRFTELDDVPPWPRRTRRSERTDYPYH